MRNFDLAPLYRATVGFDRIADLMDRVVASDIAQPTYPPYNIEKTAEDAYRISIAVAGFTPDELSVEVKEGALIVAAYLILTVPLTLVRYQDDKPLTRRNKGPVWLLMPFSEYPEFDVSPIHSFMVWQLVRIEVIP